MKDLFIEAIKNLPIPTPIMPTRIPTSNVIIILIILGIAIIFNSILILRDEKNNENKKLKN